MIEIRHKVTGKVVLQVQRNPWPDLDIIAQHVSEAELQQYKDETYLRLDKTDLAGANLAGAYLHNANLLNVNLSAADLSGSDLSDAFLFGANLSGANLSGADLSRASLQWANLAGADLNGTILRDAKCGYATQWSEGFDPAEHGANVIDLDALFAKHRVR